MSRRLIAYGHGIDSPATRFRIGQYMPLLEQAGWEVSLRPQRPARPWDTPWRSPMLQGLHSRTGRFLRRVNRRRDIDDSSGFDCVLLNRDLLEGRREHEDRLFLRNARVIFDFDDAIYLGSKAEHVGSTCARAAWVVVGNETLATFARRYTSRVTVIPTAIDVERYLSAVADGKPRADMSRVRVGWLGSHLSIEQTLFPHVPMLAELQSCVDFELVVMTRPRPALPASHLRWRYVEWSPQAETRIADHFDIGIMPLVDDAYQRGKCGCKLLQYMAAGLPAIASPVGVNAELLGNGSRGCPAATADDWRAALKMLSRDPARRRELGTAGRRFVAERYSVRRWFPELLSIIERVSSAA